VNRKGCGRNRSAGARTSVRPVGALVGIQSEHLNTWQKRYRLSQPAASIDVINPQHKGQRSTYFDYRHTILGTSMQLFVMPG
jgi:hypothetical protein